MLQDPFHMAYKETLSPLEYERVHHYKYHTAAGRVLLAAAVTLADSRVLPFSIPASAKAFAEVLQVSSNNLKKCSRGIYDLGKLR